MGKITFKFIIMIGKRDWIIYLARMKRENPLLLTFLKTLDKFSEDNKDRIIRIKAKIKYRQEYRKWKAKNELKKIQEKTWTPLEHFKKK